MSRSRRLARQAGGDALDAREGGHQQQGVGQLGPVAVLGPDGVGEPAQLPPRTAGRRCHPPSRQSRAVPARARWCCRAQAGPAGAAAGDVDLVHPVEAAGGVAGEQAV